MIKPSNKKLNILLSSYSVNPYLGSEDSVGWNWTVQLSKIFPNSTIYLVTKKFNEKDTRRGLKEFGLTNVKLIIVDVPNALNWFREKHSAFHHMYYMLWQEYAYKWAKKSGIHFDIIHHITMGNYRITGKMYKFKDSYTIFGPVGGGQITPPSLKSYYGKAGYYETFRELVNKVFMHLPTYKKRLASFSKLYAVNNETQNIMKQVSGKECDRICDIAIAPDMKNLEINHNDNDTVELIYLGRFIELKGIMLLIDVAKEIKSSRPFHISLYGAGELQNKMQEKIDEYKINDRISIAGSIDHTQVSEVYKDADIFVHPTFRDSGGVVFVEAMAHKLPVVALNQSFQAELNENECGLFVNIHQSKEDIVKEFAENIAKLIDNYDLRTQLGNNGYNYANNTLTLENKVKTIYKDFI